jgi:hypothetical protein
MAASRSPWSFALEWHGLERIWLRSRASDFELTALFCEQSAIIARVPVQGAESDGNRWLAAGEIALEDHDNW